MIDFLTFDILFVNKIKEIHIEAGIAKQTKIQDWLFVPASIKALAINRFTLIIDDLFRKQS